MRRLIFSETYINIHFSLTETEKEYFTVFQGEANSDYCYLKKKPVDGDYIWNIPYSLNSAIV